MSVIFSLYTCPAVGCLYIVSRQEPMRCNFGSLVRIYWKEAFAKTWPPAPSAKAPVGHSQLPTRRPVARKLESLPLTIHRPAESRARPA